MNSDVWRTKLQTNYKWKDNTGERCDICFNMSSQKNQRSSNLPLQVLLRPETTNKTSREYIYIYIHHISNPRIISSACLKHIYLNILRLLIKKSLQISAARIYHIRFYRMNIWTYINTQDVSRVVRGTNCTWIPRRKHSWSPATCRRRLQSAG